MSSTKRKQSLQSIRDPSYVSKLQQLRDFVGPLISESDLTSALRQNGYSFERAAEALIMKTSVSNSTASSERYAVKDISARDSFGDVVDCIEIIEEENNDNGLKKVSSLSDDANAKVTNNTIDDEDRKLPADINEPSYKKVKHQMTYNGGRLLLCSRWIVGLCTSRRGSIDYKHELIFSVDSRMNKLLQSKKNKVSTPIIRFRGKNSEAEGTLPQTLCVILAPLLLSNEINTNTCNPLITIEGHSLMEVRNLFIGNEIPICLNIYIEQPRDFFELFDPVLQNDSHLSSISWKPSLQKKTAPFLGKKSIFLPLNQAAYALLDWAEFGDEYIYDMIDRFASLVDNGDGTLDENNYDETEQTLLSEDDFKAETEEVKLPEWTENILGGSTSKNQENIPEEIDPHSLTENGVKLHCYQRQALYWMIKRETDNVSEEISDEMKFLDSLIAETMPHGKRKIASVKKMKKYDEISCECGPVTASERLILNSPTISGVKCSIYHPLWQRRLLASSDLKVAVSFFVNDLLKVASMNPPNPPIPCRGGILADAMGLGKTVMILSLLSKSAELNKESRSSGDGGSIIITPLSLVQQWADEVKSKTNLSCFVYYGDSKIGLSPTNVDVVITSYGTVQSAFVSKGSSSVLVKTQWERVILDEAHIIKNPDTIVSKACCSLLARKRWCVTGTPIQNTIADVYGLLKFLKHEPWCEPSFWKNTVNSPLQRARTEASAEGGEGNEDKVKAVHSRVKRLLQPILLRRTRDSKKSDGNPILTLPPLEVSTIKVYFTPPERAFYLALLSKTQSIFDGYVRSGTANRSFIQIFALLQRLRQSCNHPALTVMNRLDSSHISIKRNQFNMKGKQSPPESCVTVNDQYNAVNETKSEFTDEFLQGILEKFHTTPHKESAAFVHQVTMKLWELFEVKQETKFDEECPICLECPNFDEAVYTPCMHLFCRECLVPILKEKALKKNMKITVGTRKLACEGECPVCDNFVTLNDLVSFKKCNSGKFEPFSLNDKRLAVSHQKMSDLLDEDDHYDDAVARQTLENALGGATSAKLEAVVVELDKIWKQDPGCKVVIFSQFLGFLDLLNTTLLQIGIEAHRLDGSMSMNERQVVLNRFSKDKRDIKVSMSSDEIIRGSVLLMSMKAGGVGLNLVAASTVFLIDPWWNSAFEDQCIHRIHRIGQNAKLVRVRKFIVDDSVEEKIVKLQLRKKEMAKDILNDMDDDDGSFEGEGGKKPTLADFAELFGRS